MSKHRHLVLVVAHGFDLYNGPADVRFHVEAHDNRAGRALIDAAEQELLDRGCSPSYIAGGMFPPSQCPLCKTGHPLD